MKKSIIKHILICTIVLFSGTVFFSSCEEDKEINPQISTISAVPIGASSCIAEGIITDKGNIPINDYGFVCYFSSNESSFSTSSKHVSLGEIVTSDTFSANIDLPSTYSSYPSYKYYVRAYVTNEKGTIYANPISFEPLVLSLLSISPSSGKIDDTITIYGDNFNPDAAKNTVQFYSSQYTATVISASSTQLKVKVPDLSSLSSYNYPCDIIIIEGGQQKILQDAFTLLPTLTGFSPKSGSFGTYVTITGTGLYGWSVYLNDVFVNSSTYNTSISFSMPNNITSKNFKLYVSKSGIKTEVPGGEFSMNKMTVTSFTPSLAVPGTNVTIYGSNFNPYSSYNSVFIGQTKVATNYSSGSTEVYFTTPMSTPQGDYQLLVSNGTDTVTVPGTFKVRTPIITSISPASGYCGTDVTINGHHFINTGSYSIYLNSTSIYSYSYDSTTYKFKISNSFTPGTYKVYIQTGTTKYQSPTDFTVLSPTLTSITPTNGASGTAVIINGTGFGTSTSNVSVKFGSYNATISAVNNTQINVIVPSGIPNGSLMVSVTVNNYTIPGTLTFNVP